MRTLLLPFVSLALVLTGCAAPVLKSGVRYMMLQPDGNIGISSTDVTTQNSVSDLGIDDTEGAVGAYVDLKWGSPRLRISTGSASYEGSGTLSGTLSIDDQVIAAGARVDSKLDLGVHNATLTFDLIPGSPELGIGFGVSGLAIAGEFAEVGTNQQVDFDETIPFPVLVVTGEFEAGPIELGGVVAGISADVDGNELSYFDIDLYGSWNFAAGQDSLGASLIFGWRQVDLDLDYSGEDEAVNMELGFSGPYVGLQLNF